MATMGSGVDTQLESGTNEVRQLYFFTPSNGKLVLMSVCTFGIYELYWFYKNWVLIKQRTGQSLIPFWRAFFAPIWAYSCFEHMKQDSQQYGGPKLPGIALLAILYFLLQASWRLPDPYWLISIVSVIAIIPANTTALAVNGISGVANYKNAYFSWLNRLAVAFGGLLLVLAVVGTLMPQGGVPN